MTPRPSTGTPRDRETKHLEVDVEYAPEPGAREHLIDLVVELLDERRRSGRRSK